MDVISAGNSLLDRKLPKMTSTEFNASKIAPVLVQIPGFNWPGMAPAEPQAIAKNMGNGAGDGQTPNGPVREEAGGA
jgi:hypothetical protein